MTDFVFPVLVLSILASPAIGIGIVLYQTWRR